MQGYKFALAKSKISTSTLFKSMFHTCFQRLITKETMLFLSVFFALFLKKSIYHSVLFLKIRSLPWSCHYPFLQSRLSYDMMRVFCPRFLVVCFSFITQKTLPGIGSH